MRYFIRIDRDSIELNPFAERKSFTVPGKPDFEVAFIFKGTGSFEFTEEIEECIRSIGGKLIPSPYSEAGMRIAIPVGTDRGLVFPFIEQMKEMIEYCGVLVEGTMCLVTVPSMTAYAMPVRSHNFGYVDMLVTCKSCETAFTHYGLVMDSVSSDTECIFTDTKCPFCDEWNCCDVEYEEFTVETLIDAGLDVPGCSGECPITLDRGDPAQCDEFYEKLVGDVRNVGEKDIN